MKESQYGCIVRFLILLMVASIPVHVRGGSSLSESYQVFRDSVYSVSAEAKSIGISSTSENLNSSGKGSFTTDIKYLSDGQKYFWAIEHTDADGVKVVDGVYAYNMENYLIHLKKDSVLEVSSNLPFRKNATLGNFNTVFRAFSFLTCVSENGFDMSYVLNREAIQDVGLWKKIEDKIAHSPDNEKLFASAIINDPKSGNKFFVVTFDKSKSWLPINWKLYWDNLKRFEYQVLEAKKITISSNVEVYWPVTGVEWIYSVKGDVGTIIQHTTTKFELNSKIETEAFDIDPSTASQIYDVDRKIFISTPQ